MEQHATSRDESSSAAAPPSAAATEQNAAASAAAAPFGVATVSSEGVTPIQVSPPQMVAIRRRRGKRRRSRADKAETPQRRAYIALLCVVFVLMAIAAVKPIRQTVYNGVHSIWPGMERAGIGLEVIALVLAGLILLYLMPGMEERILRLINGGGTNKRSSDSSKRR